MNVINVENHSDPQLCRQCKGLCCQGHPGVWVDPQRFQVAFALPPSTDPQEWQTLLSEHHIVLREIDGVLVPAPRKAETGCVFLSSDGCQLDEAQRPCQCLALTPSIDTLIEGEICCSLPPHGSTLSAIKRWKDHWQIT